MSDATATKRLPAPERRRQLIEVGLDVFGTRGYHETSMAEIAEAAGVTKPVLYRHFASKQEFYLELLRQSGAIIIDTIGNAAAEAKHPRDQVYEGFTAYFMLMVDRPSIFAVMYRGGTPRDPEFEAESMRVESEIATFIGGLIDVEGIKPQQRKLLALGVVGIAQALSRHAETDLGDLDPHEVATQIADLVWAGLRRIG